MNIGLTSAELASIRVDINDLLPDTGYILDVTNANVKGDFTQGTSMAANGTVTYRLDPETARRDAEEQVAAGAVQPFYRFVLTLQYDTTITTEQLFQGADGDVYEVISIDDDKSWRASVRAFVERRTL